LSKFAVLHENDLVIYFITQKPLYRLQVC